MIARLREVLELVRALHAVPHLISTTGELEQRCAQLEKDAGELLALVRELYVGPAKAPAEGPVTP